MRINLGMMILFTSLHQFRLDLGHKKFKTLVGTQSRLKILTIFRNKVFSYEDADLQVLMSVRVYVVNLKLYLIQSFLSFTKVP